MTIIYDHKDQSDYYKKRCYHLCLLAGVEPFLIDSSNVQDIDGPMYLTVTGPDAVRYRNEISNILLFAETLGYYEDDINA